MACKVVARVNFGRTIVNRHAVVVASVVEIHQPQGQPLDFPFIGDANSMIILNICPQDDGIVRVVIDTNWTNNPINIRFHFIVNPG